MNSNLAKHPSCENGHDWVHPSGFNGCCTAQRLPWASLASLLEGWNVLDTPLTRS
ncbi:hypothetical protein RSAG8_12789, partial [Rhizoctonia solani AG-8 WAC10335]